MSDTGARLKPAVLALLWIAKLVSAGTLGHAALEKFSGAPHAVEMFTLLEMEPGGRILIGAIEALAALLILLPQSAVYGAFLGLGVMLGALIGHLTVLGPGHISYAALVVAGCVTILYIRRDDAGFLRNMWDH
jgi:putative oxidoreductase